jgi:hypothetical protein
MSIICIALLLTLAQTAAALVLAGPDSFRSAYERLHCFDSNWYASIAELGYRCQVERLTEPGYQDNVAFFPGYPLAATALMQLLALPAKVALPLTAQLACFGFWTYFLLLLRRWDVPLRQQVLGLLAVLLYPGAFFLIVGYSESLFVMLVLGYIYWSEARGRLAWLLAALHGIALTATRFVGVAVVGFPVVHGWLQRRRLWPRVLLATVAMLGVLAFFAYCQAKFGRWEAYLRANEAGWRTRGDYFAVLRPSSYRPTWPATPDGAFCPDRFSRNAVPLTALFFAGLLWRESGGLCRNRAALLLIAGLLFYLAIGGKAGNNMGSMLRVLLPVHVVLVLCAVRDSATTCERNFSMRSRVALLALIVVCVCLQGYLVYRFTHGLWVA